MSTNEKDLKGAEIQINKLVKTLVKLSNGKPISSNLEKKVISIITTLIKKENNSLKPYKKPHDKTEEIAALIFKNFGELSKARTKHNNPAEIKDEIANITGSHRRTVTRLMDIIDQLESDKFTNDISILERTNPKRLKSIYSGIGKTIIEEFFSELDKNKK